MRGKRVLDEQLDDSNMPVKQIIIGILILVVLFGLGFGGYKLVDYLLNKPEEAVTEEKTPAMEETINGYDVLGKIKIEKLGIDTYILDSIESEALKVAAGKINGGDINEEGNFCVIGHNYDEIFAKLLGIEKEEKIILVDEESKESTYTVTDVYTVEPEDLNPLLNVEDKTVLTLITCETTGTTRLVVVAEKE